MAHVENVDNIPAFTGAKNEFGVKASDSPDAALGIQRFATPSPQDFHRLNDFSSSPSSKSHNFTNGDTKPDFKLSSVSIDEPRPFKVVVIGAGFSGILAGIRFPQYMKNLDLTIYEKNAGVGGTWWSNRYPGVACDYPAHCYQFSFEEKTDWSAFYSPGPEIRQDLERVVEKYKLMRYIKLSHELKHARYDEQTGKWHLKLHRPKAGTNLDEQEVVKDEADFVLLCVGSLSRPKWPMIEGLKDFKGKLMHSAEWYSESGVPWEDSVAEWKEKSVGVIGAGSTAIQIVSALQSRVDHVYEYVRGKIWVSPSFLIDDMLKFMNRESSESNYVFSDEDKERLKEPEFFKRFRRELEVGLNSMHYLTIKGSGMNEETRKAYTEHMKSRLSRKPWIAELLIPDFSVGCRRITPGPGYLEALQEDNVELVSTHIAKVTETGLELVDGTRHVLDVIVCATGFDTSFQYPFEVVGRAGKTLKERYTPHAESYLSLCTDGFPNWFVANGPNAGYGTGSFLPVLEAEVAYTIKVASKLQRERLKSIEPKTEAVADFDEYIQAYLKGTVFDENCRSWYKNGNAEGRNTGIWPGSTLHTIETLKRPRWEDFNYEYLDTSKNRFYWLGDGSTYNEKYMVGDRAWYLHRIDYPPVPGVKGLSGQDEVKHRVST